MTIAVISDLHLGCGDPADRFGHADPDFLRFLRRLEGDFERIVLLGDVFETLTSRPRDGLDGLVAASRAHPAIARRIQGPGYLHVAGNHDLVTAETGAALDFVLHAGGLRILFTHGHVLDWAVRNMRRLSEWATWLAATTLRRGLGPLYRVMSALDRSLTYGREGGDGEFRRLALDLARRRCADVVVTGHTHVPGRLSAGGRLYLNSGACIDGRFDHLAIDTGAGVFEVRTRG